MDGNRIKYLQNTLKELLLALPPNSYFNIVSFGSSHEFWSQNSLEASPEYITAALKFCDTLEADLGGTEILEPIKSVNLVPVIKGHPR
jgi:hypothetical protein